MRAPFLFSAFSALAVVAGCGTSTELTPGQGDDGGGDASMSGSSSSGGGDASTGSSSSSGGGTDGSVADAKATTDAAAGDGARGPDASQPRTDGGAEAGGGIDAGDGGAASTTGPVLQFHHNINRDGFYVDTSLTKARAATMHHDTTFNGTIVGNVYGQPLYVPNGPMGHGAIYVATEADNIYALDERTGLPLWQLSMGTAATNSGAGCGNIHPIGITGTPAIDLTTRTIVFDAVTADNQGNTATHTVYGLSIDDGSERWHVDMSTLTDQMGRSFSPQPSNSRSAVLIVNGNAYVSYGGYTGDCGNYHGWITSVSVADGLTVHSYAVGSPAAGMWAPGGPSSDGTSIFAVTGNHEPLVSSDAWQGEETVFRFGAGVTFTEQNPDYWVPANWGGVAQGGTLDAVDADLGGSGLLVVDAPSMTPSQLLVAQGKDGKVYLLDRNNLGGLGAAPFASMPAVTGIFIQSAAFATISGTTYITLHGTGGAFGIGCPTGQTGDLFTLKLDPTAPNKMTMVWCTANMGEGSPIITTSDGTNNALVWTAGAEGSNRLHAWDLLTGAPVFTGGTNGDLLAALRHFTTVLDANGRIIVGADNKVFAFTP